MRNVTDWNEWPGNCSGFVKHIGHGQFGVAVSIQL